MTTCTDGCKAAHAHQPFASEIENTEKNCSYKGLKLSLSGLGKTTKTFLAGVGAKIRKVFSSSKPAVSKPIISISAPTGFVHHKNMEFPSQTPDLPTGGMPVQGATAPVENTPPAKPPRMASGTPPEKPLRLAARIRQYALTPEEMSKIASEAVKKARVRA
ncbi:MAG TPA: hypothetical protein VGN04_08930 [Herbaspirillum sp.]